jgi:hypothetical protein
MRKHEEPQAAKIEASRLPGATVGPVRIAEVQAEIVASHTQVCNVRRAATAEASRRSSERETFEVSHILQDSALAFIGLGVFPVR